MHQWWAVAPDKLTGREAFVALLAGTEPSARGFLGRPQDVPVRPVGGWPGAPDDAADTGWVREAVPHDPSFVDVKRTSECVRPGPFQIGLRVLLHRPIIITASLPRGTQRDEGWGTASDLRFEVTGRCVPKSTAILPPVTPTAAAVPPTPQPTAIVTPPTPAATVGETVAPTPATTTDPFLPPGTYFVHMIYSGGSGECGYPTGFDDNLIITVTADSRITITQPSTGDSSTGTLTPDGSFVAAQSDPPESYTGQLKKNGSGQAVNKYTDSEGCTSTWLVVWPPP